MVYGARLESVLGASPHEFESRILRPFSRQKRALIAKASKYVGWARRRNSGGSGDCSAAAPDFLILHITWVLAGRVIHSRPARSLTITDETVVTASGYGDQRTGWSQYQAQ